MSEKAKSHDDDAHTLSKLCPFFFLSLCNTFSSSCLLLSTQEVQQIVVRQRCTVHTAVRSVRVDRCHPPATPLPPPRPLTAAPLVFFQQQLCQMLRPFRACLFAYLPWKVGRRRGVRICYFSGQILAVSFKCIFKSVPVPKCHFFL